MVREGVREGERGEGEKGGKGRRRGRNGSGPDQVREEIDAPGSLTQL